MNIVILAAGTSSRMGQHKLLIPVAGKTLLQRAAQAALEACPNVLVVLGRDASLVRSSLQQLPLRFVVNDHYENGKMETSFQTAITVLELQPTIFMLADMPLVDARMLRVLAERANTRFAPRGELPLIVASRYGDVLAPPHLFMPELLPEVAQYGAKPTIKRHFEQTVFCDWDESCLFDVDTPQDLQVLESVYADLLA
ncbi:MAG: NTP transferase domain-containing protein [Deinococcales bacterium]